MAKNNNGILYLGIGLVVLAGASIGIYYATRKPKHTEELDFEVDETAPPVYIPQPTNPQDAYNKLPLGQMPLKKGQKSKFVWIFQDYFNCRFNAGLKVDGDFGSKTEAALLKWFGVKSIASWATFKAWAQEKGYNGGCEAMLTQKLNNAQSSVNYSINFTNFVNAKTINYY